MIEWMWTWTREASFCWLLYMYVWTGLGRMGWDGIVDWVTLRSVRTLMSIASFYMNWGGNFPLYYLSY